MLNVIVLNAPNAECRYAECRYAECRYAECHYAECCYAECRAAYLSHCVVLNTKCHYYKI